MQFAPAAARAAAPAKDPNPPEIRRAMASAIATVRADHSKVVVVAGAIPWRREDDWPDALVDTTSEMDPVCYRWNADSVECVCGRSSIKINHDGSFDEHAAVDLLRVRLAEKKGCAVCGTKLWHHYERIRGGVREVTAFLTERGYFDIDSIIWGRKDHKGKRHKILWSDVNKYATDADGARRVQVLCKKHHKIKTHHEKLQKEERLRAAYKEARQTDKPPPLPDSDAEDVASDSGDDWGWDGGSDSGDREVATCEEPPAGYEDL